MPRCIPKALAVWCYTLSLCKWRHSFQLIENVVLILIVKFAYVQLVLYVYFFYCLLSTLWPVIVCSNAINTLLKFSAWVYTGSHSMFSEFVHSLADTLNQVNSLLTWVRSESLSYFNVCSFTLLRVNNCVYENAGMLIVGVLQIMLAIGVRQSLKEADSMHP